MFFKSLSPDIRRAMIFGLCIIFGGGAAAISALVWGICYSGTVVPTLVACAGTAFLTWLVTLMIFSR